MLLAAGLWLRVAALDRGWFGVDQARDVAVALDVAAGEDWPTVGPTMRRIVRLGALYHYVWAAPYLVWRDPMAGYWFAAFLGVVSLLVVWALARRLWGPRAGLLALAVAAAHPVWVIDGRIAWAPAALPAAGAGLLWLVLGRGPVSARRAAATGALLGLGVQLHLTMLAWVVAAVLLAALERLPLRTLLAAAAAGLLVGFPAVTALFAGAAHDVGLGGLTGGGDPGAVATRALHAMALPWRVTAAFSGWDAGAAGPGRLVLAACAVVGAAGGAGLLRLLLVWPRGRATRLLAAVIASGAALVLAVPGEVWWYYLDAVLPACALAAAGLAAPARLGVASGGAVVSGAFAGGDAPTTSGVLASDGGGARRGGGAGDGASGGDAPGGGLVAAVALAAVAVAALVLAAHLAGWLLLVGARGYMPVDPALLALDERPGADAATRARLVTVGVKRALAEAVAAPGGDFAEVWPRFHGPAFDDATGDNGFWLRWALARRPGAGTAAPAPVAGADSHLAVWYADEPLARALAAADAAGRGTGAGVPGRPALTRVGPLLLARYEPAIDYAACAGDGRALAVPIRVLPHPRRYGDGRPARPRALPKQLACALRPGSGRVLVVARLDGQGSVRVRAGDTAAAPGRESALCIERAPAARPFVVEIELPAGTESALDLYDVPSGVGCTDPRPVL